MENKNIEKLRKSKLNENLKSQEYIDKIENIYHSNSTVKKSSYLRIYLLAIKGVLSEINEINARKKYMTKVFGCDLQQVAGDINDFIKLGDKTLYYASDFNYSVLTKDDAIKNIKVIWGNANLLSLDDAKKLASIQYITGDIYYNNETYSFDKFKDEVLCSKVYSKK